MGVVIVEGEGAITRPMSEVTLLRHEVGEIPDHFTGKKRETKLVKDDVVML